MADKFAPDLDPFIRENLKKNRVCAPTETALGRFFRGPYKWVGMVDYMDPHAQQAFRDVVHELARRANGSSWAEGSRFIETVRNKVQEGISYGVANDHWKLNGQPGADQIVDHTRQSIHACTSNNALDYIKKYAAKHDIQFLNDYQQSPSIYQINYQQPIQQPNYPAPSQTIIYNYPPPQQQHAQPAPQPQHNHPAPSHSAGTKRGQAPQHAARALPAAAHGFGANLNIQDELNYLKSRGVDLSPKDGGRLSPSAAVVKDFIESEKSHRQPWHPTVKSALQDLLSEWHYHAGTTQKGATGQGDGDGKMDSNEIQRAIGSTNIKPATRTTSKSRL